jgi:hypothetical protein
VSRLCQAKYTELPQLLELVPPSVPVVLAAYANDTLSAPAPLPVRLFSKGELRR